jgi:hypothetical protein
VNILKRSLTFSTPLGIQGNWSSQSTFPPRYWGYEFYREALKDEYSYAMIPDLKEIVVRPEDQPD